MLLQEKEFARIVKGEVRGNFTVDKIAIDSRTLQSGETFLALRGENHDGHNFIAQAIDNKCNAVIVDEEFFNNQVNDWFELIFERKFYNFIIVKDTYQALIDMAIYIREQFQGHVIGITGSIGKTTTKELFKQVFKNQSKITANLGNLNNHIGLPLSICNMDSQASIAVFEMGMSSSGEIAFLSNILKPNIGIITEVSESHSEFFNSVDEIANAKIEILEGMDKNKAILFLNQDNQYYDYLKSISTKKGYRNIYTFSLKNIDSNCYSKEYKINFNTIADFGTNVTASIFAKQIDYKITSFNKHHILLANLILGVAYKLQLNVAEIAESMVDFQLDCGRGKISRITLPLNKNKAENENILVNCIAENITGWRELVAIVEKYHKIKEDSIEITLIDDSYNASPVSMQSAIANLQYIKHVGDIVLVLSDMLELGQDSLAQHLKLLGTINELSPTKLITLGDNMKALAKELGAVNKNIDIKTCDDYREVIMILENNLSQNSVVFIKGSNSSKAKLVAKSFY